jgi:hypothetical protein
LSTDAAQQGSSASSSAVEALSIITFLVSLGLAVTLLVAFFVALWRGAVREQNKVDRRRSLRASLSVGSKSALQASARADQQPFTTNPLLADAPNMPASATRMPPDPSAEIGQISAALSGSSRSPSRRSQIAFTNPLLAHHPPTHGNVDSMPRATKTASGSPSSGVSPQPATSRRVVVRGSYFASPPDYDDRTRGPLSLAGEGGGSEFQSHRHQPGTSGHGVMFTDTLMSVPNRMRGSVTNRMGFGPTSQTQETTRNLNHGLQDPGSTTARVQVGGVPLRGSHAVSTRRTASRRR